MLIEYGPTVQLSVLVNSLKAVTSRRLRNEFLDLRGAYSKPVPGHALTLRALAAGAPLEVIKQYISKPAGLTPGEIPPTYVGGVPFAFKMVSVTTNETLRRQLEPRASTGLGGSR